MDETTLAAAAAGVTLLEQAAFLEGGGNVELGEALAAHAKASHFRKVKVSGDIRSYELKNVVLDGETLVLFDNGRLLGDTCYFVPDEKRSGLGLKPANIAEADASAVHVIACNMRQHHYAHWMAQCLPTIDWSVRHYGRDSVCLVFCEPHPWQDETLALLDLDSLPRLVPEPGTQYRLPTAVYSEFINGAAAHQLSLRLTDTAHKLTEAVGPKSSPYSAIYVPTTAPFFGSISNEAEVVDCLVRHGVHVFAPDSLTLADRVALFHNADVVIGPHGHDLTDCMFCKPGTLLWELMPGYYQSPSKSNCSGSRS